jgi:hypothetical protein
MHMAILLRYCQGNENGFQGQYYSLDGYDITIDLLSSFQVCGY